MARSHRAERVLATLGALLVTALLATACSNVQATPQAEGTGPAAPGSVPPSSSAKPSTPPPPTLVQLATDRGRQSQGVVAAAGGGAPYNYAPSVMLDGGRYRMWWCTQLGAVLPHGDDIVYAESGSADGPFASPDGQQARPVFAGNNTGFDSVHVCDPSVLRVGATYYMYYTGADGDHPFGSAIGVATSPDGVNWTRANNDVAILGPMHDVDRQNTYGSGQPSVVFLDGWFYLMFTDTSGKGAAWNGAGQFVLRSTDPAFVSGVQTLTDRGFVLANGTKIARERSIVEAFSADWMWVDALNAFAIAHETDGGTTVTFWDRDFTMNPFRPVVIPGVWKEGPGLVRRADGHAPISTEDPCGRVQLDVVRSTVEAAPGTPTDLRHFGIDIAGAPGCRTVDQAAVTLRGFAIPSPDRTIDLVVDGRLVRVERRSVADRLALRVLDQRPAIADQIPLAARLPAGAKALHAPDGSVGLVLDDNRLWSVGSAEVASANSSPLIDVLMPLWADYAKGPDLASLRS
ncbi:beta-xylosidase [Solihabitans fulvus]|uniref:beta-xylosidase n=1 Tax=Solihabitans fulvus TaxID=1892852 RepID=UPI001661D1B9|nr:beta-xylosidase [Solihabitans fulvus]